MKIFGGWRRKAVEFTFTGNCPVREHTADGHYVGRCDHSTYEHVCPRHGNVSQFLPAFTWSPGTTVAGADDRLLPPREQRDFGSPALRAHLGVSGPRRA